MSVLIIGLTFLCAQLIICTASVLGTCQYYDAATKANFDLSPLQLSPTSSYNVHDVFDTRARNFSYVFNVCAPAAPPAATCGNETVNSAGTGSSFAVASIVLYPPYIP
jgi:hypothetical protein